MSVELVTTLKASLVKTGGGLSKLVAARKAAVTTMLLIDCSYSMNDPTGYYGGPSKMDALRRIVGELRRDGMTTQMVGFGISRGAESVGFIESVPDALGGTPLTEAILFAQHYGAGHLVVISDGQPNDPHTAMAAAQQFGGAIDVFFVGPKHDPGEQFLTQLAQATSGKCQQVSLSQPKALTEGLRLMLNA